MQLRVGKQVESSGFRLPLNTLLPVLDSIPVLNYELKMRYRLYGRGFEMAWAANNSLNSNFFLSSNFCPIQNNLGVGITFGSFFYPDKIIQNTNDWNELLFRQKDNYVWVWLNQKLLFQSDISSSTGLTPVTLKLYFGPSTYDFEIPQINRIN
jgi:hypothetical protein